MLGKVYTSNVFVNNMPRCWLEERISTDKSYVYRHYDLKSGSYQERTLIMIEALYVSYLINQIAYKKYWIIRIYTLLLSEKFVWWKRLLISKLPSCLKIMRSFSSLLETAIWTDTICLSITSRLVRKKLYILQCFMFSNSLQL